MTISKITKNQSGFTLVQAVFILVVLGMLGMVMVRLIGVQTATGIMALQQARVYHAASSGLEWGAARAISNNDCNGTLTIESFEVTVTCSTGEPINEGTDPYNIYNIESHAKTLGEYGSPYYVSRKLQMKVGSYDVE